MKPKRKVFVSYARKDSTSAQVGELVRWLGAQEGIEVISDHLFPYRAPVQGWYAWMQQSIEAADIVLCICGEFFKEGFEKKGGTRGVAFEGNILTADLYKKRGLNKKVHPILPAVDAHEHVPESLEAWENNIALSQWDKILCLIREATGEQPALGPPPMPPPAVKELHPTAKVSHPVLSFVSQGPHATISFVSQGPSVSQGPHAAISFVPQGPTTPQSTRVIWVGALGLGLLAVALVWGFFQPPASLKSFLAQPHLNTGVIHHEYKKLVELFEHTIESTPKGASVFLDGVMKGVTPLTLRLPLSQDSRLFVVRLELDGYQPLEFETQLGPHIRPTKKQLRPLPSGSKPTTSIPSLDLEELTAGSHPPGGGRLPLKENYSPGDET